MKTTVFVAILSVFAIAVALAFWLVTLNRASEKIVGAVVPIATAALVGVFLTVFVFSEEPPLSRTFPVAFYYGNSDRQPVGIPGRRFEANLIRARDFLREHPDAAAKDHGAVFYHHVLQRTLFDWIALRHFGSWDNELLYFDTGMRTQFFGPQQGSTETSTVLRQDQLQALFAASPLAAMKFVPDTLAVPPNTEVQIVPPSTGQPGEIQFKNPFVLLSIRTTPSDGGVGVGSCWLSR